MQLKPGDTFTADNVQLRIVEGPNGEQNLELDDTANAEFYVVDEEAIGGQRSVFYNGATRGYEADDPEEEEDGDGAE
jgi:hypothetical protein